MSRDEASTEVNTSTSADALLLTQADIAVAQLTADGTIASVNDAFLDLTSYPRNALLGEPFSGILTTLPPSLKAILQGEPTDPPISFPHSPCGDWPGRSYRLRVPSQNDP